MHWKLRADEQWSAKANGWMVSLFEDGLAYRMPLRFLSVAFVGLGVAVALLLEGLRSEGLGVKWRALLVGGVLVDTLLFTGALTDPALTRVQVPVGYSQLGESGAVLDLRAHDRYVLRQASLSTFYQMFHEKPILANHTQAIDRQDVVNRELGLALVSRDTTRIQHVLGLLFSLGVHDIAFHPNAFHASDALQIRTSLSTHCAAVHPLPESGPDPVEVFRIPATHRDLPTDAALAIVDGWIEDWRDG